MTNLANNLVSTAKRSPSVVAIKLDDVEITFGALELLSQKIATILGEYGIERGDRVALMMPNIPQMAFVYYGVLRTGAVVVPLNPLLKGREVAYHLTNSGARLAFAWEGVIGEANAGAEAAGDESGTSVDVVTVDSGAFMQRVSAAEPSPDVVDRDGEDTAVVLYTSGTTGRPKGATLSHTNLARNTEVSRDLMGTKEGEVLFGGLPFFHIFGQTCALNASVLTGATLTLLPRFEPGKALEIIARDRVTIFEGVPTMYVSMLRTPSVTSTDLSSVRLAVSGGSALPVEVLHEFERVFKADLLEGYGLSETSPIVSFNRVGELRKPGSIGTPVEGVEVRMLDGEGNEVPQGDVGELSVRGHCVMKGYWQNEEATRAAIPDGWFRTGDLARFDEDGLIFIVDRKKEVILRGGYNVYPREVEEVLYEHPAVAEAAVIGVPDELHGEEIVAVVGIKSEHTPADDAASDALAQEIVDFAKERVAAYKYPRRVVIVDALPKGPTGKILKREITV
ncbi:long-chain fatty acid--CoA ligase [Arthrobacter echini]|uniref:Long-chain fatty acid--CoA ligase n=1 Tax=Arthrobacter echini TaxID=1529066 RepID=A0A4S5E1D5_9MICC|nr:long-chain fatty acid--CoA ligase [Arthrobacter echini]THJ65120.1 long-chain fatty acid--CoA ligase [Arthrobacter echini]